MCSHIRYDTEITRAPKLKQRSVPSGPGGGRTAPRGWENHLIYHRLSREGGGQPALANRLLPSAGHMIRWEGAVGCLVFAQPGPTLPVSGMAMRQAG